MLLGSCFLRFSPLYSAASRDPGRTRTAIPGAGQGAPSADPKLFLGPREGALPALRRARRGFGGAPRPRVWRPQGQPKHGAPARLLLEHAPGAAGARAQRLGPGREWVAGRGPPRRTGSDCNAEGRKAPAQPAAESRGWGLGRWGQGWWAGGWRGGGICPPELSGPLSGRGSDPGDRNRARGAVTR